MSVNPKVGVDFIIRERIPKETRIRQIKEASKKVFLEKGFSNTVMNDIMEETGLSRGGLYHYYSSTNEIMYDLMKEGDKYRYKKFEDSLTQTDRPKIETIIHLIIDKMLVANEYTRLYVMFLCQLEEDKDLKALYEEIKSESINSLKELFSNFGYDKVEDDIFEFIINLINANILACELLGARPNLMVNQDHIYIMLNCYLKDSFK